ncbi:hypothetical protein Pcinc_001712 [Petrolisthes cinctipes]|uniref:Uncharacterized protein n=1 Tax=Petrolisthes cinctipes TaxID=88211 RepID=A0AAE1GMF1_PETCI|nr:hypothetical protein Pcinc_001712 [Petrolisthes cinctipes]
MIRTGYQRFELLFVWPLTHNPTSMGGPTRGTRKPPNHDKVAALWVDVDKGEQHVDEGEYDVDEGKQHVDGGEQHVDEGEYDVDEGEQHVDEGEYDVDEGK